MTNQLIRAALQRVASKNQRVQASSEWSTSKWWPDNGRSDEEQNKIAFEVMVKDALETAFPEPIQEFFTAKHLSSGMFGRDKAFDAEFMEYSSGIQDSLDDIHSNLTAVGDSFFDLYDSYEYTAEARSLPKTHWDEGHLTYEQVLQVTRSFRTPEVTLSPGQVVKAAVHSPQEFCLSGYFRTNPFPSDPGNCTVEVFKKSTEGKDLLEWILDQKPISFTVKAMDPAFTEEQWTSGDWSDL